MDRITVKAHDGGLLERSFAALMQYVNIHCTLLKRSLQMRKCTTIWWRAQSLPRVFNLWVTD